jgi:Zn-dependent protease
VSFLARVFGSGENPLRWAVPLYTAFGIAVRLHVFFIVYIVVDLLSSLRKDSLGIGYRATLLGVLFGLVLLHEYGHCIACRKRGGDADEIILWPLGGLALCRPPHDWLSNLVTTIGGPAVNLVLLVPLGLTVYFTTGLTSAALFNLFDPSAAYLGVAGGSPVATWLTITLVSAHIANTYLLLFNVLLPMYPMDGGRILHALLWKKHGYYKATDIATLTGMVIAGVVAVVGIVTDQSLLFGIAAFGGLICWLERRQARFADSGGQDAVIAESQRLAADDAKQRAARRRDREAAAERQAEIDRILAKIAKEGMGTLTKKERRTLEEESAAKRTPQR